MGRRHSQLSLMSQFYFVVLNDKKKSYFLSSEKLDKGDSKADSSSSAKLVTLTKAIDSIQENSKSLESMGRENLQYVC